MPDQAQVSPAGRLVRGQGGGCFRRSLLTEAVGHRSQPRLPTQLSPRAPLSRSFIR